MRGLRGARVHIVYGSVLVLLGCWAAFTTWKSFASRDRRRTHRALGLLGTAFATSCFLSGFTLLSERFRPWMLIPLGACYLFLIPFPCYFKWANHGWIRTGRSALFLLIGVGLIAAGLELLPLSWFGL